MTDTKTVALSNDHAFKYAITRSNATSGAKEAATGLTLSGWFSATDGGAALTGTTTSLAELSGKPGTYMGTLGATALTAALTPYVNRTVYEVVSQSGHLLDSVAVLVTPTRRPS